MQAWIEYLLYFGTATIPEIAVALVSLLTLAICADSYRVHREDLAIIRHNGGDSFAFRESAAQGRSALGRGVIAAIFLFLGIVAARTPAVVPLLPASLVSFALLALVNIILAFLQAHDRRDRRANIRDLLALRRARESSAAGIIAIDRHSVILQFNAAAERILGYTADEAVGMSMTMLMPERFRADHLRGIARAYTSTTPGVRMNQILDLPGLRKDGTEVPLHITLSETTGVAGKVFQSIFTEETPGSDKVAKDVDELRHDAQMERAQENIEMTEQIRQLVQEAKDAAAAARDVARDANDKIELTNMMASAATQRLDSYVRQLEGERKERDQ